MNNWMKRRIERSRARCEKSAANHKTDKDHETEKQSKHAAVSQLGGGDKDS